MYTNRKTILELHRQLKKRHKKGTADGAERDGGTERGGVERGGGSER